MEIEIALGAVLVALMMTVGGYFYGHSQGVDSQAMKDQKQFDQLNVDISNQKASANKLYQGLQTAIIDKQNADAQFNLTLEKTHADNQTAVDALRRKYAGNSLHFTTQVAGCRQSSGGTESQAPGAPLPQTTTDVQLPDLLGGNLRQLTTNADLWVTEYKKCYAWTVKVAKGDDAELVLKPTALPSTP